MKKESIFSRTAVWLLPIESILLGVITVVFLNLNCDDGLSVFECGMVMAASVLITLLIEYAFATTVGDCTVESARKNCLRALLFVFAFLFLLLQVCTDGEFLSDSCLLLWNAKKNYIAILSGMYFFPLWLIFFAGGKDFENFKTATIALTVLELVLFWQSWTPYIWLMGILHCITLWAVLRNRTIGCFEEDSGKFAKGYAVFWVVLGALHYAVTEPFGDRLLSYVAELRADQITLFCMAHPIGRADYSEAIHSVIGDDASPLHSLCYYFGWVFALVYAALIVLLAVQLVSILRNSELTQRWNGPIVVSCAAMLLSRIALGALGELFLLPFSVGLPFEYMNYLWIDSACIAILLCTAYGNPFIKFLNDFIDEFWPDTSYDDDEEEDKSEKARTEKDWKALLENSDVLSGDSEALQVEIKNTIKELDEEEKKLFYDDDITTIRELTPKPVCSKAEEEPQKSDTQKRWKKLWSICKPLVLLAALAVLLWLGLLLGNWIAQNTLPIWAQNPDFTAGLVT